MMRKKSIYLYILLVTNKNFYSASNKLYDSFEKIEEKISKFSDKSKNVIGKVTDKVKASSKKLENKIENKFYELGEFTKNDILYVPLNEKTILIYLKKNFNTSIFFKNPKILTNKLNKLHEMLPYLPLPIFEVAIKNQEEEAFDFIKKFGVQYHIFYNGLTIIFILTLICSLFFNKFESNSPYEDKKINIGFNSLIILVLMVFFPSKTFYLDNKIKIFFYLLHISLLSKNFYYTFNTISKEEFFSKDYIAFKGIIISNLLFSIFNIIYVNYYPCEYNRIKIKIEKLSLTKRSTVVSTLTDNQDDDYGLPAGNIEYLNNI